MCSQVSEEKDACRSRPTKEDEEGRAPSAHARPHDTCLFMYDVQVQYVPSLWNALDRSISTKEIQPKTLEYSESAHQKTLILWLVALFRPTVLLQEEVKVPSLWHDFTLFMTTYDLLRSPSTYVNTKRGYRRDFFFVYVQES